MLQGNFIYENIKIENIIKHVITVIIVVVVITTFLITVINC